MNLKIAWRRLWKNRTFTLINLLGLSLGLAAALAVILFVKDELSYGAVHERADRIVSVNVSARYDGNQIKIDAAPNQAAPFIREQIPGVQSAVRLFPHQFGEPASIRIGRDRFVEENLFWADSTIFDVFSYELLRGRPDQALNRVNSAILSASAARRLFGGADPLGQTFEVDQTYQLEVTGVFRDLPESVNYRPDIIGSFQSIGFGKPDRLSWGNASFPTFLLMHAGQDPAQLESSIAAAMEEHVSEDDRWFSFSLKPLRDIHLYSADVSHANVTNYGDIRQVRILIGLAILLVLIACINYTNLATARSQDRGREVGVNKTLGATRGRLAWQFYAETGLLALVGILLSVALLAFALPWFNQLSGKSLTLDFLRETWFWLAALATWVSVTFLAGSYPAAYLSSFRPVEVLQSGFRPGSGDATVRKGLVVFQFGVSMILIVATLVFYLQLDYIRDKKLGYDPEQVVALRISGAESSQIDAMRKELIALASVMAVSRTQTFPGRDASGRTIRRPDDPEGAGADISTCRAHPEIFEVLDLDLLAGRPMRLRTEGDTISEVVLNRSAIDYLGLTPQEAVGRPVEVGLPNARIVGVVEDFHYGTLRQPIGNYALHNHTSEWMQYLLVKMQTDELVTTMQDLEGVHDRLFPNLAFDYTFLDDHLSGLYRSEVRVGRVVMLFAGLAIFVACLGLFALVAYTAERRTKEIGVRKVLGASVFDLAALLSKDLLRLVLISILVAVPLAWLAMRRWLEGFAYRIDLSWWIFLLAGLAALLIALATVGLQSLKAARRNPVEALRDE